MKKILAFVLAVATCALSFSFVGCGVRKQDEAIDTTKTQLYVGNMNYGFGDAWLNAAKTAFEERFKDYEFEPGKMGAQLFIDNGSQYGGNTLISTVGSTGMDVIFGESTAYNDFVNTGHFLDITDIVTEPLTEYGETRSIADKLTPVFGEYLRMENGKYYALPNYECNYRIIYNKGYFNEEKLFFKPDGTIGASLDDPLGSGPDGIAGNYDDGLPATFDQFFALCEEIKDIGDDPITWPGGVDSYRNVYLSEIYAALEGKQQYELGYNFNGGTCKVVKFDTNGKAIFNDGIPVLEEVTITPDKGYEIYRQAGRYWAINFLERIFENVYHTSGAVGGKDHITTQADFINSRYSGSKIAMLFDGNFWTNEADDAFTACVVRYGDKASKEKAEFSVMPIPRPEGNSYSGKNSYSVDTNSLGFIYSGIPENRKAIAKKFLQFLYTDAQLIEYTQIVGTPRGCDVDFSDVMDTLPVYVQDSLKYRADSDLSTAASHHPIYANSTTAFVAYRNGASAFLKDNTYNDAIMYLRGQNTNTLKSTDVAKEYFEGIRAYYTQGKWNDGYSKWF